MDFLARAGAFIDRGHRLAGILLVVSIVLALLLFVQNNKIAEMTRELNILRSTMPVYVVPAATTGIYSPTRDDQLVKEFANFISQSFNTFTYETFAKQVNEARQFMNSKMLTDAEAYFQKRIQDAQQQRLASLFVPNRESIAIRTYQDASGIEKRDVVIQGVLKTIVAGTVAEDLPLQINLTFEKTFVSRVNPFGFLVAKYAESAIPDPNATGNPPPVMAPAPQATPSQ